MVVSKDTKSSHLSSLAPTPTPPTLMMISRGRARVNFRGLMNINRFVLVSSIEIMNIAALLCEGCHANSEQLCILLTKYFTPLSSDTETHSV